MEWLVALGIQILYGLSHHLPYPVLHDVIHCERFYVVLFDVYPLICIDVTNSYEHHMFERQNIGEPFKTRDLETAGMTQRMSVVARIFVL